MEKFSLFDILTFLLPGAVALQLMVWANEQLDGSLHRDILIESDIIAAVILLFVMYMLGTFINYLRSNNKIFWARTETSFKAPLSYERSQFWLGVLDRACKLHVESPLMADDGISDKGADRLFDYSFELLEQEDRIDRTASIRLQAFFLENTKTVFILAIVGWGLLMVGELMQGAAIQWKKDLLGIFICGFLALTCHVIAHQRWKLFYQSAWQNFYVYHRQQELTNKNQ